jgi:hypothetical protein
MFLLCISTSNDNNRAMVKRIHRRYPRCQTE